MEPHQLPAIAASSCPDVSGRTGPADASAEAGAAEGSERTGSAGQLPATGRSEAPRHRASNFTGRKASETKKEFNLLPGTGAVCKHCDKLVKDKQLNGTLLAKHLYSCSQCPLAVRQMAWGSSTTLQKTKPRPIEPQSSRFIPVSAAEAGSGESGAAPGSTTSGPIASLGVINASSPGLLNFLDRVTPEQAATIDAAVLRFFVACRISFRSVESPTFISMLKTLRPAYVSRRNVPTRRQMAGPLLDRLYEDTLTHVTRTLSQWCSRRKAVLVLDAWENVRHDHIVNLMAIVGGTAVFLDSVYCGDECQDAEGQAQLLQEKLLAYGGLTNFNAVGSDNTASCLEMRRLVTSNNPGLVSLNDQAHVANLVLGDLCKIPWMRQAIQEATAVSLYVRNHQRLLAAYTQEKSRFNQNLDSDAAKEKRTAVAYASPCATRFLYNRDLLLTCVRNRLALRNVVERNNGADLARLVKPRDQTARDAQATFLRVVESATSARDWAAACHILDPVGVYLRLFDGQSTRLSLVLPATLQLYAKVMALEGELRISGSPSTAPPSVFSQACAAVKKRMCGPTDRSVRVLLLTDVHYLAAALDPTVFDAQAPDVGIIAERAFIAIRTYFVRSPHVFSPLQLEQLTDDQRMLLLREEFTTYAALSGTFVHGAGAARRPGAAVDVASLMASEWDLWGWWTLFGGSTPALREIGKALAGMSPSSCAVERSFSLQKSIHSLIRNRLTHDRVAKLMFIHTNLNLMGEVDLSEEELDFLQSASFEAVEDDAESAGEGGEEGTELVEE